MSFNISRNEDTVMREFSSTSGDSSTSGEDSSPRRAVTEKVRRRRSSVQKRTRTKHQCRANRARKSRTTRPLGSRSARNSPQRRQKQSVVVFDWDDTLLCTSYMTSIGAKCTRTYDLDAWRRSVISEAVLQKLEVLASEINRILLQAIGKVGVENVIIITNGDKGWVELSAELYVPSVLPLLQTIKIVSARTSYEHFCERASSWKVLAFYYELQSAFDFEFPAPEMIDESASRAIDQNQQAQHKRQHGSFEVRHASTDAWDLLAKRLTPVRHSHDAGSVAYGARDNSKSSMPKQVISYGDSNAERLACQKVCDKMQNTLVKTIKFLEKPTIDEVIHQLRSAYTDFSKVVCTGRSLDLQMNPETQETDLDL